MYIYKRMIAAAVCVCILCCGCASGSSSSSQSSKSKSTSSSLSDSVQETDSSQPDEVEPEPVREEPGELLSKAAELFQSRTYSFKCTLTDSEGNVTEIVRHVMPDNYYQLQRNAVGTSGSVCVDGEAYDFDNVCGLYTKSSKKILDNTVINVVNNGLPRTSNHIKSTDLQEYDIEEYTYTGETYITAFDFYFDKNNGDLKKYITTYSVEGSDDIVETREFTEMSPEVDETLFNLGIMSTLTNYDEMTRDECQQYFEECCDKAGVTDADIRSFGYHRDELGALSYDEIVELVYSCGYKDVYEGLRAEDNSSESSEKTEESET